MYLGDEVISQEEASRMDILDYADRHQLRLALEVHDVITYVLPNNMPSTHRVVRIDAENQHFYTNSLIWFQN